MKRTDWVPVGEAYDLWRKWNADPKNDRPQSPWHKWCGDHENLREQRAILEARAAAERAASAARVASANAAAAEETRKRQEADARARALLDQNLSEAQRKSVAANRHFEVHGKEGRRYRIEVDRTHGNVKEVDARGRAIATFCAQPNGVPVADAVLAQKLLIETDEAAFLRVANKTQH